MRVLLTGASGFIGSALLPRLLEAGFEPRALVRDRARLQSALAAAGTPLGGDVEVVVGDAVSGAGLERALQGVEVAYYLIHSMEATGAPGAVPFPLRERRAAENFARAARTARVQRIVYLGGLVPPANTSPHLASRHAVEQTIVRALPDSVALRASIVIGARSRSFRLLVRLVERLPVIALPSWRRYRTQPIDERDVVEMLLSAATSEAAAVRTLDAAGPDTLSYGEMIRRIADSMLVGRPTIGLGLSATPLAGRLAAAIAGESPELVLPLMEGLSGDLLADGGEAAALLGVTLHSFDAAVEHALRDWEKAEPLAAR